MPGYVAARRRPSGPVADQASATTTPVDDLPSAGTAVPGTGTAARNRTRSTSERSPKDRARTSARARSLAAVGALDSAAIVRAKKSKAAPAGRITPEERFDPTTAWRMEDLASACTIPGLDASHRLDLYWSGAWDGGSFATWYSRPSVVSRLRSGILDSFPQQYLRDKTESLRVKSVRDRRDRIALLGALHGWRTATAEQIACLTGNERFLRPFERPTADAVSAHLIDLGVIEPKPRKGLFNSRRVVYRPSKSAVFDHHVKSRLSWSEWVAVTGGQDWIPGGQYDRHNLLSTEFGLRAAEYTDVLTVLGERFCSVDMLAGTGAGLPPIESDQRTADACLVRHDGMRVAIELTATRSRAFEFKAMRWARLLAERPFADSGLSVIFVIAPPPDEEGRVDNKFRTFVYETIAKAVREYPGVSFDRVASRIGVATWREFFPAPGLISDNFLTMRADRPTGPAEDLWESAHFLDPTSVTFTAANPTWATSVADNAAVLAQTPYWLRADRDQPNLVNLMLRDSPLATDPEHLGVVAPPRIVTTRVREGATRRRTHLTQGVGGARDAKPPSRLMGLPVPHQDDQAS